MLRDQEVVGSISEPGRNRINFSFMECSFTYLLQTVYKYLNVFSSEIAAKVAVLHLQNYHSVRNSSSHASSSSNK